MTRQRQRTAPPVYVSKAATPQTHCGVCGYKWTSENHHVLCIRAGRPWVWQLAEAARRAAAARWQDTPEVTARRRAVLAGLTWGDTDSVR